MSEYSDTTQPGLRIRRAADLGAVLSAARAERGFTQQQFADELGITRAYLHELEKGSKNLYITRLLNALNQLNVELTAHRNPPQEMRQSDD